MSGAGDDERGSTDDRPPFAGTKEFTDHEGDEDRAEPYVEQVAPLRMEDQPPGT